MDIEEIKKTYEDNEISCNFDEGGLIIKIKDDIPVGKFVQIAIEYMENFSELEGPQSAIIINGLGDTSREFFFNLDSELEAELE